MRKTAKQVLHLLTHAMNIMSSEDGSSCVFLFTFYYRERLMEMIKWKIDLIEKTVKTVKSLKTVKTVNTTFSI